MTVRILSNSHCLFAVKDEERTTRLNRANRGPGMATSKFTNNKIMGGAGPKGRTTHNLCPDSCAQADAPPPAPKLLSNKFARSLYRSTFGPALNSIQIQFDINRRFHQRVLNGTHISFVLIGVGQTGPYVYFAVFLF